MLKVNNLTFQYPNSQLNTLDEISIDIHKGDWVVIQGPSGSGKTTLALALSGFLFHYSNGDYQGSVEINGQALEGKHFSEVADLVYLVQQNPENQFCTLTVRDEIAFGLENRNVSPESINNKIQQALEIVHGEKLADANLLELSGGEKQKIAIATAIALRPEIIILDEPTSNLDPVSSCEVFQALNQMKELDDITVVIIEHKIQQAQRYITRKFVMDNGRITEQNSSKNKKKNIRNNKQKRRKKTAVSSKPVLNLKNFSVLRHEKTVVGIDEMIIYPGEFVAMVGPNGSGKTSFLLGLLNLLETKSDTFQFMGTDNQSKKTSHTAEQCGYVFQNPDHQLFCESIEEEVYFAPKNFGRDIRALRPDVTTMLKGFGLDEKMDVHPFHLSFGQKKRLNLASVLAYKPKLLLLDEIFIGQDEGNIDFALEYICEYIETNQAAVILVNHYLDPLRELADRLIFLDMGRVLFDAPMKNCVDQLRKHQKYAYLPEYCK